MAVVFEKPKSLTDVPFHYCPGCTHGIVHRLIAEVMDELEIEGITISSPLIIKLRLLYSIEGISEWPKRCFSPKTVFWRTPVCMSLYM